MSDLVTKNEAGQIKSLMYRAKISVSLVLTARNILAYLGTVCKYLPGRRLEPGSQISSSDFSSARHRLVGYYFRIRFDYCLYRGNFRYVLPGARRQ